MKVLMALLVTVLMLPIIVSAQAAQPKFAFLEHYNGLYAYNVKLMENKQVKQALVRIIGISRFNFIKSNCGVETPMEVKDGIFTVSACQAHNCSDTNFIIVINIPEGKLYAGIRENGKVTLYPSGTAGVPQLTNWVGN